MKLHAIPVIRMACQAIIATSVSGTAIVAICPITIRGKTKRLHVTWFLPPSNLKRPNFLQREPRTILISAHISTLTTHALIPYTSPFSYQAPKS